MLPSDCDVCGLGTWIFSKTPGGSCERAVLENPSRRSAVLLLWVVLVLADAAVLRHALSTAHTPGAALQGLFCLRSKERPLPQNKLGAGRGQPGAVGIFGFCLHFFRWGVEKKPGCPVNPQKTQVAEAQVCVCFSSVEHGDESSCLEPDFPRP